MKHLPLLIILLAACQVKKETQNNDINRLHDIWALTSIQGEDFDRTQARKHPVLEIYVADMRVSGNDGCNNIMGSIEVLTETEFKFGMLAGTKMMCQDMEVADRLSQLLPEVRKHNLKEMRLHFYDEAGKELLVYKKVD